MRNSCATSPDHGSDKKRHRQEARKRQGLCQRRPASQARSAQLERRGCAPAICVTGKMSAARVSSPATRRQAPSIRGRNLRSGDAERHRVAGDVFRHRQPGRRRQASEAAICGPVTLSGVVCASDAHVFVSAVQDMCVCCEGCVQAVCRG